MLSSSRATFFALTLLVAGLRCYPVQAQDPPTAVPQQVQPPTSPAVADESAEPKPGQVVRPWQPGDPEPKGPMQIVVIEGQNGVNIIKKKKSVEPLVEVRDGRNSPLAGAAVTFASPTDGPSVTFPNGLRSISVITDPAGRATVDELKPLSVGSFEVTVSATFRSLSGTTTISMSNELKNTATTGAAKGGSSGISGKTIGILVAVGAAAAVGIGVGLSGKGSSSTSTAGSTATIGTGSGATVGTPH